MSYVMLLLLKMYKLNIYNYRCDVLKKTIQHHRPCLDDPQAHAAALLTLCSGKALMPCCPTFTDGLNLCPQLRRINPASADIISCFTLSHRMQEELPTSLLQTKPSPLVQFPDRDPKNSYHLSLVPNTSSSFLLYFRQLCMHYSIQYRDIMKSMKQLILHVVHLLCKENCSFSDSHKCVL